MRTPREVVKLLIDEGIYPEREEFMCHAISIAEDDIITNEEADATRDAISALLGMKSTLYSLMMDLGRFDDLDRSNYQGPIAVERMKKFWLEEFGL